MRDSEGDVLPVNEGSIANKDGEIELRAVRVGGAEVEAADLRPKKSEVEMAAGTTDSGLSYMVYSSSVLAGPLNSPGYKESSWTSGIGSMVGVTGRFQKEEDGDWEDEREDASPGPLDMSKLKKSSTVPIGVKEGRASDSGVSTPFADDNVVEISGASAG